MVDAVRSSPERGYHIDRRHPASKSPETAVTQAPVAETVEPPAPEPEAPADHPAASADDAVDPAAAF